MKLLIKRYLWLIYDFVSDINVYERFEGSDGFYEDFNR